jgi:hypothetical protein
MQYSNALLSSPVSGWARVAAAVWLAVGCTSAPAPSAVVTGKVTLAGHPVTAGTVLFMTDAGDAAAAELADDGRYTLRCRPDLFKIAITPPPPVDPLSLPAGAPKQAAAKPAEIPRRYHDFGTSGLVFEAKQGDNQFDIALSR